jgi:hypothetical protein
MKIMSKPAVVIYTHTDMEDVWKIFFGQYKKYMSEYKTYICVNQYHNSIPSEYIQVYYDDSKTYTEKLVTSLDQINENIILFTHEDMILYSNPNHDLIEKYTNYIFENMADSVKLLYAEDGSPEIKSLFDKTLIINNLSKLSIQPTIILKSIMRNIAHDCGKLSIWKFEESIISSGKNFSSRVGGEKKRGIYHYDSIVFPYIATAINKGKWNMTEYYKELDLLFKEYNINPFNRGIW